MFKLITVTLIICLTTISSAKYVETMVIPFLGYYIPTGSEISKYESNLGIKGQIELRVAANIGIDIAVDYFKLKYNSNSNIKKINVVPVSIGTRFYWFEKGISPFTGIDLTASTFDYEEHWLYGNNYSVTKLGYSIIQGILIPLSNNFLINNNFILTRIYTGYSSLDYFTLNYGIAIIL
ncbi:MAG: hypothetical protein HZB41_01375 [Ignavibacteriae bacterium]|nr:hypothetical protein [Ignavibacteriota bacterium]